MFKYLIDWPFLAILVAFNMVRISEQVYMILYKQGVSHEPQQVWRRDTKCPFIKQNVLAIIIIGDRAAKQILPLWHVWGSIHCRWGFYPWNPHSGGDWEMFYISAKEKNYLLLSLFLHRAVFVLVLNWGVAIWWLQVHIRYIVELKLFNSFN